MGRRERQSFIQPASNLASQPVRSPKSRIRPSIHPSRPNTAARTKMRLLKVVMERSGMKGASCAPSSGYALRKRSVAVVWG